MSVPRAQTHTRTRTYATRFFSAPACVCMRVHLCNLCHIRRSVSRFYSVYTMSLNYGFNICRYSHANACICIYTRINLSDVTFIMFPSERFFRWYRYIHWNFHNRLRNIEKVLIYICVKNLKNVMRKLFNTSTFNEHFIDYYFKLV